MPVPLPTTTRRTLSIAILVGLVGCFTGGGPGGGKEDNPALEPANQQGEIELTSPDFDDGEEIPEEYGYQYANVNPSLEIDGVPEDAASLALVVDDPDALEPAGHVWVHWLVWDIPPETNEIPEQWEPGQAREGTNDFGDVGYGGPSPPDRPHTYRFKLYALETTLELETGATIGEFGDAFEEHVVAQTQLTGTFAP
ncbi:YbhB/YbcL family Raf kinase inhibitor-like protein [Natrialbaceae archaeon A-CW3]